jgi:O-antigen ligase
LDKKANIVLFSNKKFRFTLVDLLVFFFCAWSLFNEAVLLNAPYRELSVHIFILSLWLLIYLFVRSITDKSILLCGVVGLWMIFSLLHAGLGLMQLHGFATSHHGLFKITGAFHNPGPFSGFIVSGLPLALGIILFANSPTAIPPKKLFYRILNYLFQTIAWITLISVLLVLPPAQSRAAWMAGLAGTAFLLIRFPNKISFKDSIVSRFKNLKRSIRLVITITVSAVVVGSATGFYLFKQGSADGRLLIWRVTTQMIKQKPITGHGASAFNALYMDEQAEWFANGKGSETQALVAGSPEAPFNELLKLWLEKGLVGLLIAGALLFYLIKKQQPKGNSLTAQDISANALALNPGLVVALQGAFISLLVFSLFSYPFDISSFMLQLVVAIAVLSWFSKPVVEIKGAKKWLITAPFT